MRILLDTATFLWITTDSERLSAEAKRLFRDPANDVRLSSVSAWEIGVKHSYGRLTLPRPPSDFLPQARRDFGVRSLALDEEATLQLGKLPALHRDPFDRMLVCQAIQESMTILTPDPLIRQYPVRTAW